MRLVILAVGRLRAGPERDLVGNYLGRLAATGRGVGLEPAGVHEVDERKARGPGPQSAAILDARPAGAPLWLLDERGEALSSTAFARALAEERDAGTRVLALAIGGADGVDRTLREAARRGISFGAMVWPHMLARVMLAEQLYRAAMILAGTPYHRS